VTPIIAPATVPFLTIRTAAGKHGCADWYLRALVALWDAGLDTGVDPVVLAAQCAHETAWGRFGGAVTPEMGNTCGLKKHDAKSDRREDHATFPMLDGYPFEGAMAHADHLRLYAGHPIDMVDTPDPRAMFLKPGTANFGSAPTVELLGGKWAPARSYGTSVVAIVKLLRAG
jgi:N-acetylmuramoyl-L-alanine amidase